MRHVAGVCINPHWIARCVELLSGSDVVVCAVMCRWWYRHAGMLAEQDATGTHDLDARERTERAGAEWADVLLLCPHDIRTWDVNGYIVAVDAMCAGIDESVLIVDLCRNACQRTRHHEPYEVVFKRVGKGMVVTTACRF